MGILYKGDIVFCGFEYGCVCVMCDENGKEVDEVGFLLLVEVLGFLGVLVVGDEVIVVCDEKKVCEVVLYC